MWAPPHYQSPNPANGQKASATEPPPAPAQLAATVPDDKNVLYLAASRSLRNLTISNLKYIHPVLELEKSGRLPQHLYQEISSFGPVAATLPPSRKRKLSAFLS
jgi:hypothetical protein